MSLKNIIPTSVCPVIGRKMGISIILLIVLLPVFSQSAYVQKYRELADSLSEVYGIPVSVMLGIAILESGSGTSRNSRLLNNHFGIVGKNNLLRTKGIKTRYKQYADVRSSYIAFCKLQTRKKYYTGLKGNLDYTLWIDAMSKAGYSEVPEIWKQRVISVIKKNNLAASD
jgi:flagellum-specific peptidoglycan hydrolase FlgJ